MYKKLYFMLFNGITDVLAALEERNYGQTEEMLKQLQMQAEEAVLDWEKEE